MKRIFLFLVVLLLVAWSCTKKKYPESFSENAPVFYFKATINNAAVEYNAGLNNYRMFSSYQLDSNNIYNLIAELKPKDCQSNCGNSIRIQINDYKISAGGSTIVIDSALKLGNFNFLKDIAGASHTVAFTGNSNKTTNSYKWNFGDGEISDLVNPTHVYKQSGKYQVCLEVKAKDGYVSSICNIINVGLTKPLNAYIQTNSVIGDSVSFQPVVSGGVQPYISYLWDFGDATFSQLTNPSHKYAISGSYPVRLKVKDFNNNEVIVNYNVVTQKDISSFAVNYKADVIKAQANIFAPSNILLSYTDENGILYSSVNPGQPNNSSFEILEISDFDVNEKNELTKKIKIKFNCVVYNGSKAISINNAETVIAVAYK